MTGNLFIFMFPKRENGGEFRNPDPPSRLPPGEAAFHIRGETCDLPHAFGVVPPPRAAPDNRTGDPRMIALVRNEFRRRSLAALVDGRIIGDPQCFALLGRREALPAAAAAGEEKQRGSCGEYGERRNTVHAHSTLNACRLTGRAFSVKTPRSASTLCLSSERLRSRRAFPNCFASSRTEPAVAAAVLMTAR